MKMDDNTAGVIIIGLMIVGAYFFLWLITRA